MRWDIFCTVIDNHGDLGVCWRLATDLAGRGEQVRLWIDDLSMLDWMAPQGCPGVQARPWGEAAGAEPGDVVIEAFGCTLDDTVQAAIAKAAHARGRQPVWLNLEYLSAEPWVERCHNLPSPVMSGPAKGLTKRFVYPGFTAATGGVLREPGLMQARAAFDRSAWLATQGIPWQGERLVSLFCYEPPGLDALLCQLAVDTQPTRVLVTAGRAAAAVQAWQAGRADTGRLGFSVLPLLAQPEFDRLLWSCDLNCVRGEESPVRALWAGAALLWQLYPQDDGAHGPKLEAWLDWLQAPASLRQAHRAWNGTGGALPPLDLAGWGSAVQAARKRLLGQDDLATQLLRLAAG